jgi:hypothetical protein
MRAAFEEYVEESPVCQDPGRCLGVGPVLLTRDHDDLTRWHLDLPGGDHERAPLPDSTLAGEGLATRHDHRNRLALSPIDPGGQLRVVRTKRACPHHDCVRGGAEQMGVLSSLFGGDPSR